jgi:hypothetical protein
VKREPEYFGEQELDLLYVAKRLKEALRLEDVLTAAGLDYLVETDTYKGGVVFQSERVGAFFYVVPADAGAAREAMVREGIAPYQTGPG